MIDTMSSNNLMSYIPFAAVFTTIAMAWNQIRGFVKKIFNLFVLEFELDGHATAVMIAYLHTHGRMFTMGKKKYFGLDSYVKPVEKNIVVGTENISSEPCLFFVGKKPIIIHMSTDKNDSVKTLKGYFLRFTFDTEKLMIDALDYYNQFKINDTMEKNRFFIRRLYGNRDYSSGKYGKIDTSDKIRASNQTESEPPITSWVPGERRVLKWKEEDLGFGAKTKSDVNRGLVLSKEMLALKDKINKWKRSETWYKSKGIPWRLGTLLFGTPGSGKTFGIIKLAEMMDLPVYVFDLGSMSNRELIENWQECQHCSPCILLFEDIDTIWNKRDNITENVGPTFDCFLNCLSGAVPNQGMFTVITTNRLDHIDEALGVPTDKGSSRPGRVDFCIKLNGFTKEDRLELAKIILGEYPEHINEMVNKTDGMTVSQCSNEYAKLALDLHWKNK